MRDAEWGLIEPLFPPARQGRPSADDGFARGIERDPLSGNERLPVADAAQGFPAALDGCSGTSMRGATAACWP